MQKFFDPSSVALIGVSRNTGNGSFNIAETMLRYGYEGKIFPINPGAKDICGLKAYPSIVDVAESIDLAVISVGRERVIPMLDQCVLAGVRKVIIITQGFADADQAGREMQKEIEKKAKANNVRILGPNTMGVVNNSRKFTTAFIDLVRPETFSPVSLIAQTGVFQVASQNLAYKHWGKAIDIGNGCDVDVVDALTYFADDPETKIIVIHMEGITRGVEFLKRASEVTFKKPVIVFKTGRSQAGAKAALSHTGSLVGEDHVFDAVFTRAGIIRVKTGNELTDAIHALLSMEAMEGPRLGVVTVTGAGGIMAADACEEYGLRLAKLPEGLAKKLKTGIPAWISVGNPIDIWPIGMIGGNYSQASNTAIAELLKSDEVDGVLAILPVSNSPLHQDLNPVDFIGDARTNSKSTKPLALWPYMDAPPYIDKFESVPGVACFNSIERAVQGLSFCYRHHQAMKRHVPVQKTFSIDIDKIRFLAEKGRKQKLLIGNEALQLLDLFGIAGVKSNIARNPQELKNMASAMTYPLVLKVTGAAFLHKTEWGGVVTDIRNLEELLCAFDKIIGNVHNHQPDAKVESVQIQEQIHGQELLLGLKKNLQFGHIIACGLGGIYTEVFKDIRRVIAPVDQEEANGMLESLMIAPILNGLRGEAGIDRKGLIDMLERLSFLAVTLPDILELDINPVIAKSDRCVAVDVRILW
jgi:acetate---CoA ligase (ADP-forming)